MTTDAALEWTDQAVKTLLIQGSFSEAVVVERKDDEFIELVDHSNLFPLFQDLPRDELDEIATHLVYKKHPAGTTFYHKGYRSDRMYFIAKGSVSLIDPSVSTHSRENRGAETTFGSFAFLTGCRHSKTVMATSDIEVWILRKDDLEEVLADTPVLASKLQQYIKSDELYHYLTRSQTCDIDLIARWKVKAASAISARARIPAIIDLSFEIDIHKYKGAPLAIWLGIFLDGIPESLVIGASLVQDHLSYSLIGGLFLSNYPEALSSSVLMRQHGFKFSRILLMWTSTMILTGIGAVLGSIYFAGAELSMFAFVQGVAAGAMLTMIAQTMLPEAYLKGGSIIGFSTLLGFLATIFLKTLE
jgi:zinc transporter ZupT